MGKRGKKKQALLVESSEDEFAIHVGDVARPGKKRTRKQRTVAPSRNEAKDCEFLAKCTRFPLGPASVNDMFNVHLDLQQELEKRPDWLRNIQCNLQYGLESNDNYSGACFNRQADAYLDCVVEPYMAEFRHNWYDGKLVYHTSSCDSSTSARKLLTKLSDDFDGGASCVFGTHDERLTAEIRKKVQDIAGPALPSGKVPETLKSEKEEAHRKLRAALMTEAETLFPINQKSWCYQHGRKCSVRHLQLSDRRLHKQRLRGSGGGVSCIDWCGVGRQLRWAGPTEPAHDMHVAERHGEAKRESEDWFWTECSGKRLCPIEEKIAKPLADTHFTKWVHAGPQHRGIAVGRERCFGFSGAHHAMVWTGPEDEEEVQIMFEHFCFKQMQMTGDVFFQSTEEEVRSLYREKLEARGCFDETEIPIDRESFLRTLPPGAMLRFQAREAIADVRVSMGLQAISDIEHWPDTKNGKCSANIAHILTHGTFYNFNKDVAATVKDICLAQGLDVYNKGPCGDTAAVLVDHLLAMPDNEAMHFIGNGINPLVFVCFQLFMWSNCQRREKPQINDMGIADSNGMLDDSDDEFDDSVYQQQLQEATTSNGTDVVDGALDISEDEESLVGHRGQTNPDVKSEKDDLDALAGDDLFKEELLECQSEGEL